METHPLRQFHALFKKELLVKFRSSLPLWGMGFFQVLMAAWVFWIYGFFQRGMADLDPFFRMLATAFTLLIPLYASGDVSEERKSGNWDLLYSFPLADLRIHLAKFLSNTVWLAIHLSQIGVVIIPLLSFGDFDLGVVKGSLIGLGIYGAFSLSLGQWISTFGKGTLLTYLFTFGLLLSLLLLPLWAEKLPFPDLLMDVVRYFSIPHHLDGFFRGTILLKDLGFFLGGVAICFLLTKYTGRGEVRIQRLFKILLVILLMWNVSLLPVGFDWTQHKTYTVSAVSKRVLSRLEGRVLISYYVSQPLILRSAQPERIMERLHAYSRVIDKVDIRIVEPARTGESRLLVQAGLRTDAEGRFSGITIEYRNELEIIPWITEPGNVEYLLTTHLLRLMDPSARTIGILKGDSAEAESEGLYPLLKAAGFVPVEVHEPMPPLPPVMTLVVLHGQGVSPTGVEMLSRFLDRGGKLLVFLDRVKVDREQNLKAALYAASGILELFLRMGITVSPKLVLDRSSLPLPVQRGEGTEAEQFYLLYPPWPRVKGDGFDREHPITQGLTTFKLFWASPLIVHQVPGLRATVLARTGPESWLMGEPFPTNPYEAHGSVVRGVDRKGSYPVAALVEKGNSKLIVVGDGQCMGDLLDRTKSYENYEFLLNALEWLSDPAGPLEIRNRFLRDRYLIEAGDKDPSVQLLYKVQLFLIPGVIFVGLVWQKIRKRKV